MKRVSAILLALGAAHALAGSAALAQLRSDQTTAQVQEELWSKERAIYGGRGRGDPAPYLDSASPNYLGWPPQVAAPLAKSQLKSGGTLGQSGSKEQLEMKFVSLTLSGDSALIYYKTHMTMRADGSPADQHFEVVHAWVREGGAWRLLGGMARPSVDR